MAYFCDKSKSLQVLAETNQNKPSVRVVHLTLRRMWLFGLLLLNFKKEKNIRRKQARTVFRISCLSFATEYGSNWASTPDLLCSLIHPHAPTPKVLFVDSNFATGTKKSPLTWWNRIKDLWWNWRRQRNLTSVRNTMFLWCFVFQPVPSTIRSFCFMDPSFVAQKKKKKTHFGLGSLIFQFLMTICIGHWNHHLWERKKISCSSRHFICRTSPASYFKCVAIYTQSCQCGFHNAPGNCCSARPTFAICSLKIKFTSLFISLFQKLMGWKPTCLKMEAARYQSGSRTIASYYREKDGCLITGQRRFGTQKVRSRHWFYTNARNADELLWKSGCELSLKL